jgi:serine/threonine protein kinase
MSKAYSNKALPAGTVLREWRLEEVLGVGGFGIVYKGRGIYFDELVAIKEYFPSSISERDEDATVVPIDSDAEEVHALGLKKFVEEAKLLWNLSTPTRHPNIVSVRSLFEIHGTAYMVMDFEDGNSLSKMIKSGKKFNEASLSNIILPIAQGLERAHRVGVLHRDIKPPNIIVNDDGRAVLIDFGSARFESGDATSTKVTFHTPPYAAIEQYVRTYEQGPWTDIYALGVLMYECITGEKPAEVLERMHGDKGKPLAEGAWPGFSDKFLAAVDAAMAIRPDERPQSIGVWLENFDAAAAFAANLDEEEDEGATRIANYQTDADSIVPVAPLKKGFKGKTNIETGVPDSPQDVQFKKRGGKTRALPDPEPDPVEPEPLPEPEPAPEPVAPVADAPPPPPPAAAKAEPAKAKPAPAPKGASSKPAGGGGLGKLPMPILVGGGALALLLAGVGGWALMGGGGNDVDEALLEPEKVEAIDVTGVESLVTAFKQLETDATTGEAPADALAILTAASAKLTAEAPQATGAGADAKQKKLYDDARLAATQFAASLQTTADATVARAVRRLPWVNPANPRASRAEPANRQAIAGNLRVAYEGLRTASTAAAAATDPGEAITQARQTLAYLTTLTAASQAAYRSTGAKVPTALASGAAAETVTAAAEPAAQQEAAAEPAAASGGGVSAAKRREFSSAVGRGRDLARQVIRMGDRDKPGANASQDEQDGYRIRQANAKTARDYQGYLDTLEASMRGTTDDDEASRSIIKANQTESYLRDLQRRSNAAK